MEKNHAKENFAGLIICREESATSSVDYSDAAIGFGWIDSLINKRDADSFYQYFARRNPKSNWSNVNKEKVACLEKTKKLAPAVKEMIRLAKATGTWTGLDATEKGELPG
jgi:uncharacterized protein YdeI (YjbR/CyaY-like superfamily)